MLNKTNKNSPIFNILLIYIKKIKKYINEYNITYMVTIYLIKKRS
jgi:hypothetical protein